MLKWILHGNTQCCLGYAPEMPEIKVNRISFRSTQRRLSTAGVLKHICFNTDRPALEQFVQILRTLRYDERVKISQLIQHSYAILQNRFVNSWKLHGRS